ncbi:MAG: formylglycine-generating enzyme family protein [Verrucomicrobiota bacterium]|nr:formylglycine-generating enzyme family protein [Verrucomicrobiota bacterium]
MRRMKTWRWVPAALLLLISGTVGRVQGLTIQSFDRSGQLTFLADGSASNYRIEWASSPSGPWMDTWDHLLDIPVPASGIVTCSVPMFYRVVATELSYLVVDISDGPTATSYPVSNPTAMPSGGWTDEYKTTKLVLRRIPATVPDFTMGFRSTDYPNATEGGLHQVTLTEPFYIGVFEVTQRQWELVMGKKPSSFTNELYYQTRPVENVSYYDIRENPNNNDAIEPNWPQSSQVHADSFMGKLRVKTGLSGFDLPTESQWEYACRAGTTTALNSGYNMTNSWFDARMDEVGRHLRNGGMNPPWNCGPEAGTALVGSYLPNGWGLYDMHGNVSEWCLDWLDDYPEAATDPLGAASGNARVLRGGSFNNHAGDCRSGHREAYPPAYRKSYYGFRISFVLSGEQ